MALAQIAEIEEGGLCERAARLGTWMKLRLERMGEGRLGKGIRVRGLGLMTGVELVGDKRRSGGEMVEAVVRGMLRRGYVVLPEGEGGEVIGLTPPLTIGRGQLGMALDVLEDEVGGVVGL
jgi:4-aminobutyrate aminotransferase-like enzyme